MYLCVIKLKVTLRKFNTSYNHIKYLALQGYKYTSVSVQISPLRFCFDRQSYIVSFKFFILGKKTEEATRGGLQKKTVLKNFFTGKHLCRRLFFNKVESLRSETLFKKRLRHCCFPVNFPNFLRTRILKNICELQLLKISTFTNPQPLKSMLI